MQKIETDIVIIGGGLSGLSCAVKLCEKSNLKIVLVESTGKLGGRTFSFVEKKTNTIIDNGQHILIEAYEKTLEYLKIIGSENWFLKQKKNEIVFWNSKSKFQTLNMDSNFVFSILKFQMLSLKSRMKFINVFNFFKNFSENKIKIKNLSVEEFLSFLKQTKQSKQIFWYPLAISIMNEFPQKSSAIIFANAVYKSFFLQKCKIRIANIGQTELYVEKAKFFLEQKHNKIFFNSEVIKVKNDNSKIEKIILKNKTEIFGKYFVSAVPQYALQKFFPEFSNIRKFLYSPIITVYLWFDNKISDIFFLCVCEKNIQWIFNRSKIFSDGKNCFAIVISAAYAFVDLSKESLIQMCLEEFYEIFPNSKKSKLVHSLVLKEKKATISINCLTEELRPNIKTIYENFFLSGDWVATKFPATIESAIQSGFMCANEILENQN